MKLTILLILTSLLTAPVIAQNCTSLFSYEANFEIVSFINQSSVPKAHYWWNFGDGTGSYFENPVHTYPETGRYLVTLFTKDTVSNCSDFYELWVDVFKYSVDTCSTVITDSLFSYNGSDYLKIIDLSTNCSGYYVNLDGGPALNFPLRNWILLNSNWNSARFLSRVQYYTYDTITGYELKREAYKSTPYNYTSTVNYDDCSANFEFTVIQEDNEGQRVFFRAMNRNADSYHWTISGFGNPIHHYTDTMSHYYPFHSNDMWNIGLKIEGTGGCHDTLHQQVLVRPEVSTVLDLDNLSTSTTNVLLFPNPFTEQSTLVFDNSSNSNFSLTMTSLSGEIVKRIANISSGQITIDRGYLASGIYFYQLWTDNRQVATGKLIIQ